MKVEKRKGGRSVFVKTAREGHYIVARMSHNGAPIFARLPRMHKNAVDAENEASCLALIHPNCAFGYYQYIGNVVGSPVNKEYDTQRLVTFSEFMYEAARDARTLDHTAFHLRYGCTPQELGVTDGPTQAACTPTQEAQAQSDESRTGSGGQLRQAEGEVGQDTEVRLREARESQEESNSSGQRSAGSLYADVYRTLRKNQEVGRGINGATKVPTIHR